MSFFKCKVCEEKDRRIAELKDQIAHLRLLVYPVNDALAPTSDDVVPVQTELATDKDIEKFKEQQLLELDTVLRERDQLLSGQY